MYNSHIEIIFRQKFVYKPSGNIFAEDSAITVSNSFKTRHDPQCKVQINEEIKISLSLDVILLLIIPHFPYMCKLD